RSRGWGAEFDRQAHPHAPSPDADRQKGPGGTQAWRAELGELRELAYFSPANRQALVAGRPPSLDPRFENAPITQAEVKALKESKEPEKPAELLSRFQNQRTGSSSHPQNALLHQAFDAYELNRLGLNPTARELAYLQAGAANGQEPARTKE